MSQLVRIDKDYASWIEELSQKNSVKGTGIAR